MLLLACSEKEISCFIRSLGAIWNFGNSVCNLKWKLKSMWIEYGKSHKLHLSTWKFLHHSLQKYKLKSHLLRQERCHRWWCNCMHINVLIIKHLVAKKNLKFKCLTVLDYIFGLYQLGILLRVYHWNHLFTFFGLWL